MKDKVKKVLLITHAIAPYRIPLFNYIDQMGDFNFKVITLAEKEKNRNLIPHARGHPRLSALNLA